MGVKARTWYALHRWLGAIVGLQLLAWAVGGFIFATHDLPTVHGKVGQSKAEPRALDVAALKVSAAQALAASGLDHADSVRIAPLVDRDVYEVRAGEDVALVDAHTGVRISPLGEAFATAIAQADREGPPAVLSATLVVADPPTEYRKKPLPAWQIVLADGAGTHIWVDARSGRITARRNDAWRRFDFFWMLHTMDWQGRDDFNTALLIVASLLAVLLVSSGLWLWGVRIGRRVRRRRGPIPAKRGDAQV